MITQDTCFLGKHTDKHILLTIGLDCQAHRGRWDYDKTEWSDLMVATFEGDSLQIKFFIEQGDAINYMAFANTHHQLTAIEIAIRIGNKTAFQLLMNTDSIPTLGQYTQRASSNFKMIFTLISN